jgi:hypothetical protein
MQNLSREFAALAASKGTRRDWSKARTLPKGYAAYVGTFGHVPLTRIADIERAALLDSVRGRDVYITLTLGADTLGTVSCDSRTFTLWTTGQSPVGRALLAQLWTAAHRSR